MYKILGSEVAANTTPTKVSNNRVIRIAHRGTQAETITLWENTTELDAAVVDTDTIDANVVSLTTGNTEGIVANMRIMGSSNLAVINSVVAAKVSTIVNSSAFTANVNIDIGNGTCQLYLSDTSKTFTMLPNSEFVVEKARTDFVASTNNSTSPTIITALPVSYRG